MKKAIIIFLFLATICFGDTYTSHQKPNADSSLDIGTSSLLWQYLYVDSITDNTALWDSSSLSGFVSIEGTTVTDGTFTVSGGIISAGTWQGSTITVPYGGTDAITLTDGGILLGSGTGAITALGVATNGQIPIGDGTTDPVLATLTATTLETEITNGAGSITIGLPDDVTITGDLTISGDDLFMGTNTDRFFLIADGTNYNPEALDLGTDTTGNYVASVATTAPLSGGAVGSEGATLTLTIPAADTDTDGYLSQTDWDKFNDHADDNSQAHSDYLVNNASDETSGTLKMSNIDVNQGNTVMTMAEVTWAGGFAINPEIQFTGGGVAAAPLGFIKNGLYIRGADAVPQLYFTNIDVTATADITYTEIGDLLQFQNAAGYTFDANVSITGAATIGDGTNDTLFSVTGVQTMTGTARVIVGEDIDLSIPKRPAANPPAEGTEAGFPTLDFDDGTDESIFVVYHLKENYASAGTFRAHLDFFVDTAPVGDANVVWGLEYQKLSHGDNFNFSATATLTTTEAVTIGTPANDKKIHETNNFNLTTTGWVPHDIILIRLYRDANNGSDNFTGDARLSHIHVDFLSDKLGEAT